MKKKMSNRDKTFWAVIIPVLIQLYLVYSTLEIRTGSIKVMSGH